jgi:D-sedoheptulose 7-phosphate isomerase
MMSDSASEYLRSLFDLALNMQVTDSDKGPISLDDGTELAIQMVLSVKESSGKVMLAGNGGSAAIVSHVQNDLCKAVGVRGLVFTEQPLMMALANDEGYESIFQRPIGLWADPGDLMITVSSSGKSENIIQAARAAKEQGCDLITFTGFDAQNPLRKMGNLNFFVPSFVYGFVETAHAALAHFMTDRATLIAKSRSDSEVTA